MDANFKNGFSLMELMTAICIIVILGAVSMPFAKVLRSQGENIRCVSNLRQLGSGILSYTADNDGFLPGPLLSGQYPFTDSLPAYGRYSQLSNLLKSYLDFRGEEAQRGRDNILICPAFKRAVPDYAAAVAYGVNIQVRMDGKPEPRQPFGYANELDWLTFQSDENYPPMRLAALARIQDENSRSLASQTYAIRDADVQDGRFKGLKPASGSTLAKAPVHGRHRNALFFDFHVEAMPTQ